MSHWMFSQGRQCPPSQVAALIRLLQTDGIGSFDALEGTGLQAADLGDLDCQPSLAQYLRACSNALRLAPSSSLALRLGRSLHLSDHGMYGLMLLTCESVVDYFRLASKYQAVAGYLLAVEPQQQEAGAGWIVDDEAVRELPSAMRAFLVEQQAAQLVTQLQDLLGQECTPALACFTHAAPAHHAAYAQNLQCPCIFGWHRNELRFDNDILARRPRLANPFTMAALQAACDGQLADIEASFGMAGKVYRALRLLPGPGADMQAVASTLKMTDRTLRRHLACEGTSFSRIADQVRYGLARQQLQRSQATVEQVAAMTGFSDSANFRRAFQRWAGMTPARFRQLHLERRAHGTHRAQAAVLIGWPSPGGRPWP